MGNEQSSPDDRTLMLIFEGTAGLIDLPDPSKVADAFKSSHSREDVSRMSAKDLAYLFMDWDRRTQPVRSYDYLLDGSRDRILVYVKLHGVPDSGLHVIVTDGARSWSLLTVPGRGEKVLRDDGHTPQGAHRRGIGSPATHEERR